MMEIGKVYSEKASSVKQEKKIELSFLKRHLQTEYLSSDWSFD